MSDTPGRGDTLPATAPGSADPLLHGACLFFVACGTRPELRGARISLHAIDQVDLRRGDALAIDRARTRIDLAIPDPRISSGHARLVSMGHRWHVEDLASRNGTFVNGERVTRAVLADGDVIDAGDTLLRYRELDHAGDHALAVVHEPGSLLPAVQRELDDLRAAATSALTILIEGETGTGKEVIARAVHTRSGRAGAWVPVNCGALPRERVAAELFGWKRGAFPGAVADHPGLVRTADGGTLFLDEIGDLPLADQAALLRVLQEHEVLPIAGTQPVRVALRVIAATHQPLDELVAEARFRRDLLARLAGFRITLRPLRERKEDLGTLVAELLATRGAGEVAIRIATWRTLIAYAWPANIRELDQALARALVKQQPGMPLAIDLAPVPGEPRDLHRERLIELLRRHRGNIAAVARDLGKARMQIQRWLHRYDIDPEKFRSP